MLNTILFDLDGTLLPISQEDFKNVYVKLLCMKYIPLGYDKDGIIKALWTATGAMVRNDGGCTNEDLFWQNFSALLGDVAPMKDTIPEFYAGEFNDVRAVTRPTELPRKIIDTLKGKGYDLRLATNPLFPAIAVETRLAWIDLSPSDFSLVTTYENSTFCKPFPGYYNEILEKTGKRAADCRMIGNNPAEDMVAAKLGMDAFLVTDCLENDGNAPLDGFPQGSLADVLSWAQTLPECPTA